MSLEWMVFLVIAAIISLGVYLSRKIKSVEETVVKRSRVRKQKEIDWSQYIDVDTARSYMNIVMILSVSKSILGDNVYYDERNNRVVAAIDNEIISIFDVSPELNTAARDVFVQFSEDINSVIGDVNRSISEARIRGQKW